MRYIKLICSITWLALQIFTVVKSEPEYQQIMPPGVKYLIEKSPPNKPSVPLSAEEEAKLKRGQYGGKGDKPHLGGFTNIDVMGLSNNSFNYMLGVVGIKSLVDVGCGKGISTKYFMDRGVKVLCVEGSHDAVTQSLLPADKIVEHDFTRGPWWPEETYDAVWSVEFLEHVGRQYMQNYLPIFHKSALIFVTSSGVGGWHHVEVHEPSWWRTRMQMHGFVFSKELTMDIRDYANAGKTNSRDAQHITLSMQVFINPKVASLPKHAHLIAGNGCKGQVVGNQDGGLPCTGVDALPKEYETLLSCYRAHRKKSMIWECMKNERAF